MAYIDTLSDLEDTGDDTKPWADFILDLVNVRLTRPLFGSGITSIAFEMRGAHESGEVAIGVSLDPESWTVADSRDFLVTYGRITLASVGEATDRLVRLYEDWWELPGGSASAARSINVSGAGINCHPRNARSETVHLKLFFEPARAWEAEDEDDPVYGELFLNFDLKAKRGWLKEKDEGYRAQVVGWLTGRLHKDSP